MRLSRASQLLDVVLFLASKLIDDAFEDAPDGILGQRGFGEASQAGQYLPLSLRVIDDRTMGTLDLSHLVHELHPLAQQGENLCIDRVDLLAQLGQPGQVHAVTIPRIPPAPQPSIRVVSCSKTD